MTSRGMPCGRGMLWVGVTPCIALLVAVLAMPADAKGPTGADRGGTVAAGNDQEAGKKPPRGDASSPQRSAPPQRTPAIRQPDAARSAPPQRTPAIRQPDAARSAPPPHTPAIRQPDAARSAPPPPPAARWTPPARSETGPAVRQPRFAPAAVVDRAKSVETHQRAGSNADVGTPPPAPTFRRNTTRVPATNDHVDIKGGKSNASTPLPAPQRDRRLGGDKGTAGDAAGPKMTLPPAGAIDRSRVNDVRKRLGGRGPGQPGDLTGHKGSSETPKGPLPAGVKLPDPGKLRLGNQPPTGVKLRDRGDLNLGNRSLPGSHSPQGKAVPYAALNTRFAERAKSGNLDRLVAGETAKKLRLADQYQLWHDGDVARRLDLEKHARNFYHGPISPAYQHHCFKYNYWGPAFFAGVCWYPSWNPWVEWSWRHHCHPFWDPRPIWCRPVIYDPCPVWVYWQVPVWTPLPEVACGTWVDLMPPLPREETDLQLVAVRFVDPGHPEEKLGPRYRVWFRNNGSQAIAQPFNVMLFAANDAALSADLPQAGVRVTAVEARDTQSVDIRLPAEVYAMNRDARGNPAPFSTLHVLVDANRELPETDRINNGARIAPAEILPVDPAAFEVEPSTASPGGEVLLAGEGLGPRPGQVLVMINGQEVEAEILGWYDLGARFTLPKVSVAGPTAAEVVLVRGDGAATNPLKIMLLP